MCFILCPENQVQTLSECSLSHMQQAWGNHMCSHFTHAGNTLHGLGREVEPAEHVGGGLICNDCFWYQYKPSLKINKLWWKMRRMIEARTIWLQSADSAAIFIYFFPRMAMMMKKVFKNVCSKNRLMLIGRKFVFKRNYQWVHAGPRSTIKTPTKSVQTLSCSTHTKLTHLRAGSWEA